MEKIKTFLTTRLGRYLTIAGGMLALACLYFSFRANFGTSSAMAQSRHRTFICSETGRPFEMNVDVGMTVPVHSPYSGKDTGYPAELCYWTADGSAKTVPTPVLLNLVVGKKGPTFCPDCQRLVVGHNPTPTEGGKSPPTETEYRQRHANAR